MEEAATPFPREETTPPVTKIYFGFIRPLARWKLGCGTQARPCARRCDPGLQRAGYRTSARVAVQPIMFATPKAVNSVVRRFPIYAASSTGGCNTF